MSTVFGRIIAGNLPCEKVFENDRILAIKDIHPVAPGPHLDHAEEGDRVPPRSAA